MAAEFKPEKPVEEMVKNLKIDASSKASDSNMSASKDGTLSDATSSISSGDALNSIKESDVDREALMVDRGIYYYPMNSYHGYYYPGSVASYPEWDEQGYFLGTDGLGLQQPVFQEDNGSVLYYMPSLQPGYNPYNPSLPGALVGVDGQYLGQHAYYPSSMFPQPLLSSGYFPPAAAYGPEVSPAYTWDSSYFYGDGVYGNGFVGDSTIPSSKTSSSQAHSVAPANPTPPKSGTLLGTKGSAPAREVLPSAGVHNQSLKPVNKVAAALPKGYFPITKFPSYTNQGKGSLLYPNTPINVKENGQSWVSNEKLKTQNKYNGVGGFDLLNEQNRGPRTNNSKTTWISAVGPAGALAAEGGGDSNSTSTDLVTREDYNLLDFPTKHDNALFFVIKSYSEDDIHKSIKYNVWASTPNGNKRLDNAFQVAQEKMEEKGSMCPVFLFFSVNASGQFCGVAEMMGRVDFNKNMDFWQQDKWNGFFPVKWHIIKDVPNPQFRHIILEYNDNKPVTNSRDTQEVKFPQGIQMLNIFKNFCSKTSILDDFGFYENRQKAMQDKRSKLPTPHLGHVLPKRDEVAAQVRKEADDLNPLVSGLQAIELGAAKKKNMDGRPQMGVEVKD